MPTPAPPPKSIQNDTRRALLEAPLKFRWEGRDLAMRAGDVNGLVEAECVNAGGIPPLAIFWYVEQVAGGNITSLQLNVVASAVFYALRQSGDTHTTYRDVAGQLTYSTVFDILEVPALPDDTTAEPDPTPGA